MSAEKLLESWAKRNPNFEKRYEDSIIKLYTDYGIGSSSYQEARGKLFGAGYEIYIIAFFIGLYFNRRKVLNSDSSKLKGFGQPIQYWGQKESRGNRKPYGEIQKYIFVALVARTEIDFIALDEGKVKINEIVRTLITTMEEYANFGFSYIEDKMRDNDAHFFRDSAFLDIFLTLLSENSDLSTDDEIEQLD